MNRFAVARLQSLIDKYMESRRQPAIISTKAASKALSTYMKDCPLQGRALENAIAASAVRHGHAVAFDLTEHRVRQALVKYWKTGNSSGVHLSTSEDAA
jgi:hypothetical protein